MISMRIHKVTLDNKDLAHTAVLQDSSGKHRLVLPLGALEAMILTFAITKKSLSFPFIHEIMLETLKDTGAILQSVSIDTYVDGIFTAHITVQYKTKQISYLCKPTDAILIAIKSKLPIMVSKNVLDILAAQKIQNKKENKLIVAAAEDITTDLLRSSTNARWKNTLSPAKKQISMSIRIIGKNKNQTEEDKQMTELLLKLNPESALKM